MTRRMPQLPLAKAVPVVRRATQGHPERRGTVVSVDGVYCRVIWDDGANSKRYPVGYLTVDVEDDQGFGYALRWASLQLPASDPAVLSLLVTASIDPTRGNVARVALVDACWLVADAMDEADNDSWEARGES